MNISIVPKRLIAGKDVLKIKQQLKEMGIRQEKMTVTRKLVRVIVDVSLGDEPFRQAAEQLAEIEAAYQ